MDPLAGTAHLPVRRPWAGHLVADLKKQVATGLRVVVVVGMVPKEQARPGRDTMAEMAILPARTSLAVVAVVLEGQGNRLHLEPQMAGMEGQEFLQASRVRQTITREVEARDLLLIQDTPHMAVGRVAYRTQPVVMQPSPELAVVDLEITVRLLQRAGMEQTALPS